MTGWFIINLAAPLKSGSHVVITGKWYLLLIVPSKPVTIISSGILYPCSFSTEHAAIAIVSLAHAIASNGIPDSKKPSPA